MYLSQLRNIGIYSRWVILTVLVIGSLAHNVSFSSPYWQWKTVTAHICNNSAYSLELDVQNTYQMQFATTNYRVEPDSCIPMTYSSQYQDNGHDSDNAATISVTNLDHNYGTLGYLTLQGTYAAATSCAILEADLIDGWSLDPGENGHNAYETCWRALADNYGAKVYITPPAKINFTDESGDKVQEITLGANSKGTFFVKNIGNKPVAGLSLTIPSALRNTLALTSNCSSQQILDPGKSCIIAYQIPSNLIVNDGQSNIFLEGEYSLAARSENAFPSPELVHLTITDKGKFSFFDLSGNRLNSIVVNSSSSGKFLIKNTGNGTISDIKLILDDAILDKLEIQNCTNLVPQAACEVSYDFSNSSNLLGSGDYDISATGVNAVESPAVFSIDVSDVANLQFSHNDIVSTELTMAPNDRGMFYLSNIGVESIDNLAVSIGASVPNYVSSFFELGECWRVQSLKTGERCSIQYKIPDSLNSIVTPTDVNLWATGTNDSSLEVSSTEVSNINTVSPTMEMTLVGKGRFDISGGKLSGEKLNVNAGSSKFLTLANVGGTTIRNLEIKISSEIREYFTGNCLGTPIPTTSLDPRESCTINFSIPDDFDNYGEYSISFRGKEAENTGASISIQISELTRIIFQKNQQVISNISIRPGTTGRIKVKNVGAANPSNFSLDIPDSISSYFVNKCANRPNLGVDKGCNLRYSVPSLADNGNFEIGIRGENIENLDSSLQISISDAPHLVLYHNNDGLVKSDLYLVGGDSGVLKIVNTGNTAAINPVVSVSSVIDGSDVPISFFTPSNCPIIHVYDQCTVSYTIPSDTTIRNFNINISADNANNSTSSSGIISVNKGVFQVSKGERVIRNRNRGLIKIANMGNGVITNFQINIPPKYSQYFRGSCLEKNVLTDDSSCSLTYRFGSDVSNDFSIEFAGDNAIPSKYQFNFFAEEYPYVFLLNSAQSRGCKVRSDSAFFTYNCTHLSYQFADLLSSEMSESGGFILSMLDNGKFNACSIYGTDHPNITNCKEQTLPFRVFPGEIALNPNSKYVYVTQTNRNGIYVCALTGIGILNNCVFADKGLGLIAPVGVTLDKDGEKIFIANKGNANVKGFIVSCDLILSNGTYQQIEVSTCSKVNLPMPSSDYTPTDIKINQDLTRMVIMDGSNGAFQICNYNPSNKSISSCSRLRCYLTLCGPNKNELYRYWDYDINDTGDIIYIAQTLVYSGDSETRVTRAVITEEGRSGSSQSYEYATSKDRVNILINKTSKKLGRGAAL